MVRRSQPWKGSGDSAANPPGNYRDLLAVLQAARPDGPGRTLDVGCNRAWLANFIDDYVGVDNDEVLVDRARCYWADRFGDEIDERLIHSTADAVSFDPSSFSTIVVKDVLEHLPEPVSTIERLVEFLEPGGLLLLSAPDNQGWVWNDPTHLRPFPRKAHRWLAKSLGLKILIEEYESVLPGTQHLARRLNGRTPMPLRLAVRLPVVPRNVVTAFQKPGP